MIIQYSRDIPRPDWITDNGHFYCNDARTYIGFSAAGTELPEGTVTYLNAADLWLNRNADCNADYPFVHTENHTNMTYEEAETYTIDLLNTHDIG